MSFILPTFYILFWIVREPELRFVRKYLQIIAYITWILAVSKLYAYINDK